MTIVVSYPYTQADGMIADGNQVMANFNAINTQGFALAAQRANPVFTGSITTQLLNGAVYANNSGVLSVKVPASFNATPVNPASTGSSAGVMMGLQNGLTSITPTTTGRVMVTVCGYGNNSGGAGDQWFSFLYFGLGTGPANGAGLQGSRLTQGIFGQGGQLLPFSMTGLIQGAALGVGLWLDVALGINIGGTAALANITMTAVEI